MPESHKRIKNDWVGRTLPLAKICAIKPTNQNLRKLYEHLVKLQEEYTEKKLDKPKHK